MKKPSAYRFVICGCCTLLIFLNMGLLSTSFTTYFPYMREIRGYSNTELYLLPTIRNAAVIVFTLFSEFYYRKLGLKRGIALTLILPIVGFVLLSFAKSFFVYEAVMIFFGYSYAIGTTIPASLLIRQWFPTHTATALGIATAGSGISFVFLPLYVDHFVGAIGLEKTLLLEAGIMAVVGIVLFILIRENPDEVQDVSVHNDKTERKETAAGRFLLSSGGGGLTLGKEIRLYISFPLIAFLGMTAISGLSMLYSTTGHSPETAAHMMSLFGFVLIAGKLLYGKLCDRFGSKMTNVLYCVLLIIGMLLNCLTQNAPVWLLIAAVVFTAIGASLASVGLSVVARDMSSPETYAGTLRNLQFIYSVGGVISGTLPGILADVTGSYIPVYIGFLVSAVLLPFFLIPLYKKKQASV